jgi:hypothetical protein
VSASQKLTKRTCDTAMPVARPDGSTGKATLWDGGDGGVKGFGLRVSPNGARSFVLVYRAGKGRAAVPVHGFETLPCAYAAIGIGPI